MTIYTVTSDPKESTRNLGWNYVYLDKKTADDRACIALIHPQLSTFVRKGYRFPDTCLQYDSALRQDVLSINFAPTPQHMAEPAIPPDRDAGWGDDDALVAQPTTNGHQHHHTPPMNPSMPTPGTSPAAQRRQHDALRQQASFHLSMDAIAAADEFVALYSYISRKLSVTERPRPLEIQKMATSIEIQLYKARGIPLSEEDEKAMLYS